MKYKVFLMTILVAWGAKAQKLEGVGMTVNSEFNELSPIISPDNKLLIFSRVSHPSNTFGEKGSQDIWYSEIDDNGDFRMCRRFTNTVNKEQYNIPYSISPDGTLMLIAGFYEKGRYIGRGFSFVKRTKGGWSEPNGIKIPKLTDLSKGQYMSGFLANDGKTLLMAFSEKKKSQEDDIYVSFKLKDGTWTKPVAIDALNTAATETTPFLASDGQTLYFSSDRKPGEGGKDIWVSKRLDKAWKRWTKPVNLGKSTNSEADEYYYSIAASGEYAYMTSRKGSIGKGDIVRIKLRELAPAENIVSIKTDQEDVPVSIKSETTATPTEETLPEAVVLIKGKVIDIKTNKPIEAKVVYHTLPDGEEIGTANTNPATGEYTIVLPVGKKYSYRAEAPNFFAIGENVDLTNTKTYTELANKELKMVPSEIGATVLINNIFFKFGKAELEPESFPELDRIAESMKVNTGLAIELAGHTDNIGSEGANIRLSQDRADAVRNYLIKKEVPQLRVTSKGYGEVKPIADNNTADGRSRNRRVEFIVIRK